MERYITNGATVEMAVPQQLSGKNEHEIVAYLSDHYEMTGERIDRPANKATAYMKAVSQAIFDPEYWKNPIYAKFPRIPREWVKAAIIWYHGTSPMESAAGIYSNGYACD